MIVLTRRHYLHLADTDVQLYKTLNRRDQVPRFGRGSAKQSEEEEAASGYLPIEAVMLALSNDFAKADGIERSHAARIIAGSPELTVEGIRRAEKGEDIWIADFAWSEDGVEQHLQSVGTPTEVISFIADYSYSDGYKPYAHVHRIAMVCASRVVKQVRERAAAIGLDLGASLLVKASAN